MSHEGKMRRGEYYSTRNPEADNIKADVEYFLEQTQPKPDVEAIAKPVEKPIKPKKEKKDGNN